MPSLLVYDLMPSSHHEVCLARCGVHGYDFNRDGILGMVIVLYAM
jgi:hypothetical protein